MPQHLLRTMTSSIVAVVVYDVDAVDGVNADNNGRSSLSFEGTSRSIASGAFLTSSGLL